MRCKEKLISKIPSQVNGMKRQTDTQDIYYGTYRKTDLYLSFHYKNLE